MRNPRQRIAKVNEHKQARAVPRQTSTNKQEQCPTNEAKASSHKHTDTLKRVAHTARGHVKDLSFPRSMFIIFVLAGCCYGNNKQERALAAKSVRLTLKL